MLQLIAQTWGIRECVIGIYVTAQGIFFAIVEVLQALQLVIATKKTLDFHERPSMPR